ncbi:hypothetical protein [Sphingomonas sp. LH128]|uniref:hypothetical protein n=1 Tax=Sphingomonas sp. LH128 TaxID=473781 RepID=UPI0002D4CDDE|nr:hypothetical protein [Sphingomonas sp. LH128]
MPEMPDEQKTPSRAALRKFLIVFGSVLVVLLIGTILLAVTFTPARLETQAVDIARIRSIVARYPQVLAVPAHDARAFAAIPVVPRSMK